MLLPTVFVVLAATPTPLAMPGLKPVNLTSNEVTLYSGILGAALTKSGVAVISTQDVGSILGLERQRQLMGCEDSTSCAAELGAALGVDGLLLGEVGHLGDTYVVNLRVVSTRDGATVALFSGKVEKNEALPDLLASAALALRDQLAQAWKHPEWLEASSTRDRRAWALVPAGIGVAALLGGVVFELNADWNLAQLRGLQAPAEVAVAQQYRDDGKRAETLGTVALGVGAVALVTSAVMFFALGPSPVSPSVWVTPSGSFFALAGRLP